jgi:hypothetical protein
MIGVDQKTLTPVRVSLLIICTDGRRLGRGRSATGEAALPKRGALNADCGTIWVTYASTPRSAL